jgi:hypothetical protein
MPYDKVRGDIRVLYAHYRFSDHASTNIVLKDKSFGKEEVWFEGFMDWTFTRCTFSKPFHFGVEGARLEEDTRGTTKNPEPFPGYGSNGLHFDTCTFSEPFDIKDNCVVVFKDCTISESITLEDNVKVEFIDCTFAKGVTIKTYCDIRFIRCALNGSDFGVEVEEHCSLEFHNCTHGNPDDFWLKATTDCSILMRSADGATLSATKNTLELDDYSSLKLYNYTSITSEEGDVVTLTGFSKIELRECDSLAAQEGTVFNLTDSEMFLHKITSCTCGSGGNVLKAETSKIRGKDVGTWSAGESHCIDVTDTTLDINVFDTLTSGKGIAILAVGSEVSCRTGQTINSAESFCIQFGEQFGENGSKGFFKDISLMQAGQSICWYIVKDSWVRGENVTTISSGESTAVYGYYARISINRTSFITGKTFGVNGDYTLFELTNVDEVTSSEGVGIEFNEGCVYDLRYVIIISGKQGGMVLSECRGNIDSTDEISSGEGIAFRVVDVTGPSEWTGVLDIEAALDVAMDVSGNIDGLRWVGTIRVVSEQKESLIWNQTGGNAYISDLQRIDSELATAATITVNGNLRVENVVSISSDEAQALILTVSSGRAEFTGVYGVNSKQADAMTINVSEGASLWYNDFNSIDSEQANALVGTVGGEAIFTEGQQIYTQMGQAAAITGNGDYSFVRFADITVFQADTPSNDLVNINGVNHVQLHRIGEFKCNTSQRYLCWLQGTGGQTGKAEVIDCLTWSGSEVRGGLYVREFFNAEVLCTKEPGTMSFEKATGIVMGLVGCNGRVANWTEITDKSGEGGTAFYVYGLAFSYPGNIDVQNIETMDGNVACRIYTHGIINMQNVGTIKAQNGDGPALEMAGEGEVRVQKGNGAKTVIIAKDDDTAAIDAGDFSTVHFRGVETQAGQGKIVINNIKKAQFFDCDLRGNIETGQSNIELYDTNATGGWSLDGCHLWAILSKLDVGADSSGQSFGANNCSLWFAGCELSGDPDWSISNSDVVYVRTDGSGVGGEYEVSNGAVLGLGSKFGEDYDVAISSGAIMAACDIPSSAKLAGATISAKCTYGDPSVKADGSLISAGDTFNSLTTNANCSVLLNRSTITGAMTLGTDNAFFGNWFSTGSNMDVGATTAAMLNHADISGNLVISDNAAAFLNLVEATGSLNINGEAVGAGVSSSSIVANGNAVIAGIDQYPSGSGNLVMLSSDDLYDVPAKDGTSDFNNGILIDQKVTYLCNAYGNRGGPTGNFGTTICLGAKASGIDTAPSWTQVYGAQSRAAYAWIIDIAPEIHHNLPGIIE